MTDARDQSTGIILEIARERRHQIEIEGFGPAHDDAHDEGELALAAAAYATAAQLATTGLDTKRIADAEAIVWPFEASSFRPTTPRRDLIKAAALLVAEIERLDRATDRA